MALQKGDEQGASNEIEVAAIERKTHPTQGFGWGTKSLSHGEREGKAEEGARLIAGQKDA